MMETMFERMILVVRELFFVHFCNVSCAKVVLCVEYIHTMYI
jgi:hypothetical protein